ncbi:hypothetical protein FB451DRAFT_1173506 [Mycena latifolia]|nr:hypothetical protein FB451DRAFT_1173506 [Mycena latifolia]
MSTKCTHVYAGARGGVRLVLFYAAIFMYFHNAGHSKKVLDGSQRTRKCEEPTCHQEHRLALKDTDLETRLAAKDAIWVMVETSTGEDNLAGWARARMRIPCLLIVRHIALHPRGKFPDTLSSLVYKPNDAQTRAHEERGSITYQDGELQTFSSMHFVVQTNLTHYSAAVVAYYLVSSRDFLLSRSSIGLRVLFGSTPSSDATSSKQRHSTTTPDASAPYKHHSLIQISTVWRLRGSTPEKAAGTHYGLSVHLGAQEGPSRPNPGSLSFFVLGSPNCTGSMPGRSDTSVVRTGAWSWGLRCSDRKYLCKGGAVDSGHPNFISREYRARRIAIIPAGAPPSVFSLREAVLMQPGPEMHSTSKGIAAEARRNSQSMRYDSIFRPLAIRLFVCAAICSVLFELPTSKPFALRDILVRVRASARCITSTVTSVVSEANLGIRSLIGAANTVFLGLRRFVPAVATYCTHRFWRKDVPRVG